MGRASRPSLSQIESIGRSPPRRWVLLALVLAFAAAACSNEAPTATGNITLAISTNGGTVGGPVEFTVTLTNGTDSDVTLVRPTHLPNFVSFAVVNSDGEPMPFYGPYKRLVPLDDDGFVTLAPGESTSETLDIWRGYQLEAGEYTVSAEYLNPAGGTHEGTRALVFEPGEGPISESVDLTVTP